MTRSPDHAGRNLASLDLVRELRVLKNRGYSAIQAVKKSNSYCKSYRFRIFYLLVHGDKQLIEDVEQGRIPLTAATHIARAKNVDLQRIFANGYKDGTVSGRQINAIRQIIDQYESEKPKPLVGGTAQKSRPTAAADSLIHHFRREADKQKLVIKRAKLAQSRLAFIIHALRRLVSEKPFVALLGAEGIHTMPSWLAERIKDQANDA